MPESSPRGSSLGDRIHMLRVRLVSDPRFQKWAASFPLTRWVARRKARALFDLCAGFVYSQVLQAVIRLGVIEALSEGPQQVDVLARRLGLETEAMRRLLVAADALDLVRARGAERYGLGDLGAAVLGNAGVAEMVQHHAALYADLRDPVGLLRGDGGETTLSTYWPYTGRDETAGQDAGRISEYSALMAASQPMIVEDVLDAYPLGRFSALLDVGGGTGGFAIAAALRYPKLCVRVADLPPVADAARQRMQAAGLAGRGEATGVDFHRQPLPEGADLISLIRVCFDHPDDVVIRLLTAVRAALPREGRLLIAEPMAEDSTADPIADAYFGFYLLAMGGGRCRTPGEFAALLGRAGFSKVERVRLRRPMLAGLLVATPGAH